MSSQNGFSQTVVGGIQDVSALLPLLGTEQCEKHVGSALDRGFLYSAVTPISIFGSLGIVRASFNILVANFNIQRYRFLGAKKLDDGGFNPTGVVAPMIALDPKHSKRFLAESRLEAMLADEHIENVEDLTVSWGKGISWWNSMLVLFTLVIAATGLIPYISLIRHSDHPNGEPLFPSGWGFPICRVLGSALCVTVAQFVIQLRILVLLKTRLLFTTVDRLAKEADIDVELQINGKFERRAGKELKQMWSSDLASEKCIWALERWFSTRAADDTESAENYDVLHQIYASQYKRQLESIHKFIPPWMNPLLSMFLVAGISLTIGGYIGCFYLIQHASNGPIGPLLWLILEATLSVIRMLVWALNPSWDDSKGVVFELQLASHPPLITCSKFQDDISADGVSAITRSNSFLEEVVAYTGPLPLFNADDVALYYIFTARGSNTPTNPDPLPQGMLYIIISDYKEQTSRILFRNGKHNSFSIYISSLEPVPGSTAINAKVDFSKDGITDSKSHFLTADSKFMDQLTAHYDEIISQLQMQKFNSNRKASFGLTWSMQRPQEEFEKTNPEDVGHAAPYLVADEKLYDSLTNEDSVYLRQGQVERRWTSLFKSLEEWTGIYIALYMKELLEDVPVDLVFKENESVTLVQKHEANEVEYLLIECRKYMEQFLWTTSKYWEGLLLENHEEMVQKVLEGTFTPVVNKDDASADDGPKQHGEEIRKAKLKVRLADERIRLFDKEARARADNRRNRLSAQASATEQRVQGRKYIDQVGGDILQIWKGLPEEIVGAPNESDIDKADDDRSSSSHSGSVNKSAGAAADQADDEPPPVRIFETFHIRYRQKMQDRFQSGIRDIENFKDEVDRVNEYNKFKQMNDRCFERAAQLFSRMEHQRITFEELHNNAVLTADYHELVDYWSNDSLQERRRLLDRTQKYLNVSNDSIRAVGGRENMARALKRSQNFSFIDVSYSTKLTPDDILSVVKSVKSITGISGLSVETKTEEEISTAVMANVKDVVSAGQDICLYGQVVVTDHYRKGQPYLLCPAAGAVVCVVIFHVLESRDYIITLRHCMTTESAEVNITLNDRDLECTWGLSQAVKFNFLNEDIQLPEEYLKLGEHNVLMIKMSEESKGVYWLSDVFLPAKPAITPTTSSPT